MGIDYYYHLQEVHVLPEKRELLEALIASAKRDVLSIEYLIQTIPGLPYAKDVLREPVQDLTILDNGCLDISQDNFPWRNLHPQAMASFLSYLCRPGGVLIVHADDGRWGYRLDGTGRTAHLEPALVDPGTKEFVTWLL
jgi:hypothetical protein